MMMYIKFTSVERLIDARVERKVIRCAWSLELFILFRYLFICWKCEHSYICQSVFHTSLGFCTFAVKTLQSCDLETKVLGLKSSRVQFLKVLVLVSRQRSWFETKTKTKTWFSGMVIENMHMHIAMAIFTSRLCTDWHCVVFSSSLQSWLKRGCLLVLIWQRLMFIICVCVDLMCTVSTGQRWMLVYALLMCQPLKLVGHIMCLFRIRPDESILSANISLLSKFPAANLTDSWLFYFYLSFTSPPEVVGCKRSILICRRRCTVLVLIDWLIDLSQFWNRSRLLLSQVKALTDAVSQNYNILTMQSE